MSVLDLFSPERLEAIDERAKEIDLGAAFRKVGRFLLAAMAFVFAGLGWITGIAVFAVTWLAAAAVEGIKASGRAGRRGGSRILHALAWLIAAVAEGYTLGREPSRSKRAET